MPAVEFGGVWPRSSSPVLGLLRWDSGFVGWGGEESLGIGDAIIQDAQYTAF